MKVGILTFHASHNYGSMLQAYALQQTVMRLGHECEIINFRTERQRRFYRPFFINGGLRSKVKALLFPRIALDDYRKYRLFEWFLHEKLQLSEKEYSTFEQLHDADLPYDAIIAGSDQIWNRVCLDHDAAYFLSFTSNRIRKIAYAPSMGPEPHLHIRPGFEESIRTALADFSAISVRESATADRIKQITGNRPDITIDPTLLLSTEEWHSLIPKKRIYDKDYILLYAPHYNETIFNEAAAVANKWELEVVVTQTYCSHHWQKKYDCFKFITAVGPMEFLNLVKNARLVISQSFHAVVFSIIFNRQFYAIDGMEDARISNLLGRCDLQSFTDKPQILVPDNEVSILFQNARKKLKPLIIDSIDYIANSLHA